METLEDRSSASGSGPSNSHREGKFGRIAGHTRGLVEGLREWIDLRVDLAILEVEEKVDDLRNEVALGVTLAFFGFFAVLFVCTTIALGLGWLLGHPFWGFLIVSVVLLLLVGGLAKTRPDLMPPSDLFERVRGREADAPSTQDSAASNAESADAAADSTA